MLTLEEAIKHCEEVAKEQDKLATRYEDASGYSRSHIESLKTNESIKCRECASEHRQLAAWLRELKRDREVLTKLDAVIECYENCECCQGFREYPTSQFIKDVIRINKEVNADGDSD